MANQNNLKMVQKQIRAFNKKWSRADSAHVLDMEMNEEIKDLLGTAGFTKAGYVKAGEKYLQSLSEYQLASLSADIQDAAKAIDIARFTQSLDISNIRISDPKSALWSMYNKLIDRGLDLSSSQVKTMEDSILEGKSRYTTLETLKEMNKALNDPEYGVADFADWVSTATELK